MSILGRSISDVFDQHLSISGNCVIFSPTTDGGYGTMYLRERHRRELKVKGKYIRAHRLAWYIYYGTLPQKNLCHKCDNPACVRISHLFEGTQKENVDDARSKGRMRGNFR